MNRIADRLLGYALLCWMARRILFFNTPALSEFLEMAWRGDDAFERYLDSVGFEFVPDSTTLSDARTRSFSELKPFVDSSSTSLPPPIRIRKIKHKVI